MEHPVTKIDLPCYDISVILVGEPGHTVGAKLTSALAREADTPEYNAALDGIEALIVAAASEGIDIASTAFITAIETAVDAVSNHLD